MGFIDEIRRRARHVIGPLFGIVIVSYFAYHTVHGDRGVLALIQMRERVADAERKLQRLNIEQQHWNQRVKLLHPASIDRDMLDERVRVMLGYARIDDIVMFTNQNEITKEKPDGITR